MITRKGGLAPAARLATAPPPPSACALRSRNSARFHPSGLAGDERGAILVLGIFMCACMVGALWYLAGIGSAILYRERMQEGADAVAFSGAVLHARGMNLIVLINLIMAAILAIRVALRVAQLALVVAGIVASLIPIVGTGIAAGLFEWAGIMEEILSTVRPAIDNGLKGLSAVQNAVARVVPPAALYGSYQVGELYAPVLETALAGSKDTMEKGLPIAEDTEDKLCQKAGEAVGSVLTMATGLPSDMASIVSKSLGKLVAAGGAYFCEMGTGGGPPDVSDDLNGGAEEACDKEIEDLEKKAAEARGRYDAACQSYNCQTSTPTQAQQAELDQLAVDRDVAEKKVEDWSRDECRERKRKEAKDKFNSKMGGQTQQQSKNGQGMTPKKVRDGWKNGTKDAQVIAVATGNTATLKRGERGAQVGAFRETINFRIPTSASFSLAQAEFFYDCSGSWQSCNQGDPMWKFRWRARLRRYNAPFEGLNQISNVLAGGEAFMSLVGGLGDLGFQNADLYVELTQIVARREFIIH